jgi:hypothetical protein
MFARLSEAERYAQWPGNLAWPILFLKSGFPGALHIPAIVIGVVYAIISILSLFVTILNYGGWDGQARRSMSTQWVLSLVLMVACEILAIVMLVTNGKGSDYAWSYGRAIFVIFAAVNIIDFFFWFYGYRKIPV